MMEREDVLRRYRHLRAIGTYHHRAALKFLARPAIVEHARRLGLMVGQTLIANSEEAMTLVFDLAIYTAKDGRSRAIDRYAKVAQLRPDSDERLMLEAMRHAQFSIWRIARQHDTCGLVVSDVLRQSEAWLVDEGLELSGASGMCFAGRLCDADLFVITSGVVVPVDLPMLEDVLTDVLACRHADPERIGDDPRFAAAIYRAALDAGVMDDVVFN
jgi:hypothetical protein